MLFADMLERCYRSKKTGLLSVTVVQSAMFPVRVYFSAGTICRFSYGPLSDKECLEFLEYYDLGHAEYLDGVKAPWDSAVQLPTESIISAVRRMEKTIHIRQWLEKGVKRFAGIVRTDEIGVPSFRKSGGRV